MSGFALLWGKILESSLWIQESKETRLVWITMLAMKDAGGIVQASVVGLADRAKVSPDECRAALKVLLSPDPDDTSKVDSGRRLHEVPGGWQIVNHEMYRYSTEARRAFWREQKAAQREKEEAKKNGQKPRRDRKPSPAMTAKYDGMERRAVMAAGNGDLGEVANIAAEGLPDARVGADVKCLSTATDDSNKVWNCVLPGGHSGDHRDKAGETWPQQVVANNGVLK